MIAELVLAVAVSASPATGPTVLDGVKVHLSEGTQQVVTVNYTEGYQARVTFWKLTDSGWRARFSADDGRIGYGGLVRGTKRQQGTGTTPLGTYALPWAFGIGPADDRWKLRYREVETGDFWVQDNESAYYNRYRNKAAGGFRWWLPSSSPNSSERLRDFPHQYEYSIVTGFNYDEPVRHRGSGIFLHVNGDGATAGCVSAPRWFLRALLSRLEPSAQPIIAIGR